ncbi:MAG TPA: hypothetical protein VGI60_18055 [Chthoniobacterales bacterium]|jgi:sugar lactone lactonase YvrE
MKKTRILTILNGAGVAALALLASITHAAVGDLYVSDSGNGVVHRFTPTGVKTTFASMRTPRGLAFDAAGNLFVGGFSGSGSGSGTIYRVTPAGTVSVFASGLMSPWGLAFDSGGNLFVVDGPISAFGNVYKFSPAGTQTVFASGLTIPRGLAIDGADNVYLANQRSGTNMSEILKFTPAGAQTTFVAGLNAPWALYSDRSGNLLETDQGGTVNAYSSTGAKTDSITGFNDPIGVTKDAAGNIFVSSGNQTGTTGGVITKIATNGTSSTFASGLNVPNFLAIQPSTAQGPAATLRNISTRLEVLTGDNVGIVGFIVQGSAAKKVIIRGIGPSLAEPPFNVPGVLANPMLSLHTSDDQGNDVVVATNDDWKLNDATGQSQETEIEATNLAPTKDLESAILVTLDPGEYTAILSGRNNGTGNGLVEAYDLDASGSNDSLLANISTRGFVGTADKVMIGGLIIGPDTARSATVVVRAIGPSLANPPFNISGVLSDPTIELHDANGDTIAANDDWQQDSQSAQIPKELQPSNAKESALYRTLAPSAYTAIVSGSDNTIGVGLVEVYYLSTP